MRKYKSNVERLERRMSSEMIYNRAHIEWAYAKYLPEFKSIKNYKRSVKYRLNYHKKHGTAYMLYPNARAPRNLAYILRGYEFWVYPRQAELSAKHLIPTDKGEDGYRAKYGLIMAWKYAGEMLDFIVKDEGMVKPVLGYHVFKMHGYPHITPILNSIISEVKNKHKLIIQSCNGFMCSDNHWTMCIEKKCNIYNLRIINYDQPVFTVSASKRRYQIEDDTLTPLEYFNKMFEGFGGINYDAISIADLKEMIKAYFIESYARPFKSPELYDSYTCSYHTIWEKGNE